MGPEAQQDQGWWCREESSLRGDEHSVSACMEKSRLRLQTIVRWHGTRCFYLNKGSFSRSSHTQAQDTRRTFWHRQSYVIPSSRSSCKTRFHAFCHLSRLQPRGCSDRLAPPNTTPLFLRSFDVLVAPPFRSSNACMLNAVCTCAYVLEQCHLQRCAQIHSIYSHCACARVGPLTDNE